MSEIADMLIRMYRAAGRRFENGFEDTYSFEQMHRVTKAQRQFYRTAVKALREQGYSDREIGECIGVQQPAITKRYRRMSR
jgi:hypothetical protein